MKAWSIAAVVFLSIALAACGPGSASQAPAPSAPLATGSPHVTPSGSAGTSLAPGASPAPLIGSWHRPQTCQETLAAFKHLGLAESHAGWLTGNFFGGSPAPTTGDVCAGALGPLEHAHFFTAAGGFGSRDEKGQQVDDGDFVAVDADTLSFPSHAAEFDPGGQILVDYQVSGDTATFLVTLPTPCDASCKDAYAWAASAFASGPWMRGEIP